MYAVETIIDLIPVGQANAISRKLLTEKCITYGLIDPYTYDADRSMRRLLSKAKKEHVIVNLQDGGGYFIPDKDDVNTMNWYIQQEKRRINNLAKPLRYAEKLLADMKAGRL